MCPFQRPLPRGVFCCALILVALAAHQSLRAQSDLAAAVSEPPVDMRLRIVWGGGTARRWQGRLSLSDGSLSELKYLGLEADEAATIYLADDAVEIHQRTGRDYDGFDILIQARPTSRLTLELLPADQPQETQHVEITLRDLINGYHHAELDQQNNQLLIQRVGGDALRVLYDRDTLVFHTGENFEFRVVPHLLGIEPGAALRCQVQLLRSHSDKQLWSEEAEREVQSNGDVPAIGPLVVALPEEEGVYEILVSLARKRFGDTFMRSKPLRQRKLQLVVLDTEPPAVEDQPWQLVDAVDPTRTSWREWLARVPRLPLLPGFRQESLGNGKSGIRQHLDRELTQLGPGGWQAYPLPIGEVGKPHILEIEYPSDFSQTLGISIIEPNALGKVVPMGLDSGVDVNATWSADRPKMLKHRLFFWPRTTTPLVLLTNRRDHDPAVFGTIRVYTGPDALPSFARPDDAASLPSRQRTLAAYFDKPLFPENFSAGEGADLLTGRSLKDWTTFYDGGKRLIEYLKHVGYNTAVVSVACQGSAIYPSKLLTPTPKYDTGIFFSNGQDPVQKDVLEMLFQLFDRDGLTLIPAVQFCSPLEELESLRRKNSDNFEGIDLVDADGRTWIQTVGANRGMAPYYNPLDRRVQRAIRHVLQEMLARYGEHDSFGGLALQLGPDTYTILPGGEWGQDAVTRRRFEKDVGYAPAAKGGESKKFRPRDRQKAWLTWRSRILTGFYRDILKDLTTREEDARLYLLGADMLTNPTLQPLLQPTLPNQLKLTEVLLQLGVDVEQFSTEPRIVFPRPDRLVPHTDLATHAANINLATNPVADHCFAHVEPAASLFFHEPLPLPLPSFDAVSPFGKENTQTILFAHVTSSAEENRRRFIHRLAIRDVQYLLDGGWMLPMGQEAALRPMIDTLVRLPAEPFDSVKPPAGGLPAQPLVIRKLVSDGQTYIYVVNDSPWSVSAEVDLQAPQPCRLEPVGGHDPGKLDFMDSELTWELELQPYDVLAAVLSREDVRIQTWRVTIDRATYAHLRQQVNSVRDRAARLKRPGNLDVLENPGFEQAADRLPGWIHAQGSGIAIGPDGQEFYAGKQSLHMTSNGPVAWIRSDPFAPPKTGRISVMARIKSADPKKQPPLRVAVEGRLANGTTYYKPADVTPLGDTWGKQPFLLLIGDLPTNGLSDLRVGFDLMGAGDVWIDDVQVFDRWFLPNERDELMILSAVAARALSKGQVSDCLRILSGYWPQYLMEYVPISEPKVATLPAEEPNPPTNFAPPQKPAPEENSSMFDKVKRSLPSKVFPFKLR